MRITPVVALFLISIAAAAQKPGPAEPESGPPSIAIRTAGMQHHDGFIPLDWDPRTGKLYLEIRGLRPDGKSSDVLYTNSLPYGTGSNDLGLDRGQISEGRVVRFERVGPKVLLVEVNLAFRSTGANAAEELAVAQSFPESVLGGFTVAAESAEGAVLIDATDF